MKNRERLWDFFLHSYQQGVWCLFVKGPLKCCHQAVICHQVLNTKLTARCVCVWGWVTTHKKVRNEHPLMGHKTVHTFSTTMPFPKQWRNNYFVKNKKQWGKIRFFPLLFLFLYEVVCCSVNMCVKFAPTWSIKRHSFLTFVYVCFDESSWVVLPQNGGQFWWLVTLVKTWTTVSDSCTCGYVSLTGDFGKDMNYSEWLVHLWERFTDWLKCQKTQHFRSKFLVEGNIGRASNRNSWLRVIREEPAAQIAGWRKCRERQRSKLLRFEDWTWFQSAKVYSSTAATMACCWNPTPWEHVCVILLKKLSEKFELR